MTNLDKLPEYCFSILNMDGSVILIKKGKDGYFKTDIEPCVTQEKTEEMIREMNKSLGITRTQQISMEMGSIFGWDCKGADPDYIAQMI